MRHRVSSGRPGGGALPPLPDAAALAGVRLRREAPGDRGFLRSLYGAQRAAELFLAPWTAAEKAHFLDEQFRRQTRHFDRETRAERWVIERRDATGMHQAIGRFYFDRSQPEWRLLEIALLPAAQGQGVGTALLEWIHAAGAAAGASAVTLHVEIANMRAAALYRRLGYCDVPSPWPTHLRLRRALDG